MEKLAELLAELRVVATELLELSAPESKALPQIESPSCAFAEDRED
jgi:hypothetical protein